MVPHSINRRFTCLLSIFSSAFEAAINKSNCRFPATDSRNLRTSFGPGVFSLLFFLLAFGLADTSAFSQQAPARQVRPVASAKIDLAEIERRERAGELRPQEKKVENETLFNMPHDLPLPRGVKGETLRVTLPEEKGSTESRRTRSSSGPNFPAIGDNGFVIPPDMGGAVGPLHVMTALNSQVQIQNKTGAVVWGPIALNNFFLPLVGSANVFDPKVLFDPFAGRWIVVAPANSGSANSALLIAVSASSDPTPAGGPWTGFAFDVDATNTKWFDYPSIGFNNKWIVATGNMFSMANSFAGAQVYIFDRAALYSLTPTTAVVSLPPAQGGTICPAVTLDNSMGTEYLVMDWNGNSGGNGYVRIHTITGTPSLPVYTITGLLPSVNQPWGYSSPGYLDFAPQAGTAAKIATNDSRMQNAVYQAGSLWFAQTAFLPAAAPTHAAVQWWQINPATASVQQFGRVNDNSAINFYAFPTISVNAYGDALLGYSSFSANQFASANYSFRLHTDAPNTMQPTVQFKAGLAPYNKTFSGTRNRWGDYSSTVTDPNNFSLCTLQEYAALPLSGQDRWGTEWACVVPQVPSLYMEDRPGDAGAEPNPSSLPMWESEDIWLRQNADPTHVFAHTTENAEYRIGTSNPNYVYVDVRNRGGAASTGTEQLTLYWAKASSGLSWPDPWNGGIYFDPPFNTMLMGQVIGTVTLPVIGPGQEYIQDFQWNPPDPGIYTGALAPDQNHFCLLARVTDGSSVAPFGMTFPEQTGDLYGNVQKNNRIAWKNIRVENFWPGVQRPAYAVIANLSKQPMNVKLKFTFVDADGNPGLLKSGTLKITARGNLAEVFRQNRLAGDGAKSTSDGAYQIVNDGGFLQGISLKPKDYGALEIVFIPNNRDEKMKGYAVTITQFAQVAGADRIVGGQTFVFGTVKGFGTGSGPRRN